MTTDDGSHELPPAETCPERALLNEIAIIAEQANFADKNGRVIKSQEQQATQEVTTLLREKEYSFPSNARQLQGLYALAYFDLKRESAPIKKSKGNSNYCYSILYTPVAQWRM